MRRDATNGIGKVAYWLMLGLVILLFAFDLSGVVAPAWHRDIRLNSNAVHFGALIAMIPLVIVFWMNSKRRGAPPA